MPPRPEKLPPVLYHWTSAELQTRIQRHGLKPRKGGFLGFHANEAGVCLAVEGDCNNDFNPFVILDDAPLRVSVDVNRLRPELFAPDLNALLDIETVYIARRHGVNLFDPETWTFGNSLRFGGCVRYLSRIAPKALRLETVQAPEQPRSSDEYFYKWSDDERSDLRATIDLLIDVGRRQGVDVVELEDIYLPLKVWAEHGTAGLKLWAESGNAGHGRCRAKSKS